MGGQERFETATVGTDINKPLGADRSPALVSPPGGRRSTARGLRLALRLVLFAAVGSAAGWAAWIARPIEPILVTASTPDASANIASAQETGAETSQSTPFADDATGTAIADIDNGLPHTTLPHLPGRSGATVTTTLSEDGETVMRMSPAPRLEAGPVMLKAPGRIGQDARTAHLPDPAVLEKSTFGPLPIRGADGERAVDIYARPWSGARGARIAIVVGGLGLSQTGTQHAIRTLPEEVTLAFASNGNSLQRWMQEARRDGHEILLQVPFEPFDYPNSDPGPGTLTVAAGPEQNMDDLHRAMARITNYTGVTNFMGGRFLSTPEALEPVMRDIGNRGILFLDDGTSARSLTDQYAKALGIPFAASDMVLDKAQERGSILARLDDLERTARRNGSAVGVASAFEISVDAIASWANEAKARGIEIVSVSAVADDPEN